MATLEKIRSKAALLVIVVGVALFAFIIGDFLQSGSTFFQQSKEKVVVVDGNSINIQDYQQRVELYRGDRSLSEEQQHQIRESVFNEMVNSILLKNVSDNVGLAVGKDEKVDIIMGDNISPMIQQMPDFQNPQTGRFDKSQLIQFLQMIETDDLSVFPGEMQQQVLSARSFWSNIEKATVEQQLSQKLAVLVSSAVVANSLDAQANYQGTSVNVDIDYVSQSLSSISDSEITITDAEISQLYNKRKELYKQDESKVIDYIALNIIPSQEDYNKVAKRMDVAREELSTAQNIAEIVNDNSDQPFVNAYASVNELNPQLISFAENANINDIEGPILRGDTYKLYKLIDTKQSPDSIFVYQIALPTFTDEASATQLTDSLIGVIKGGKSFADMATELTGGRGNGELGWQTELTLFSNGADLTFVREAFDAKVNEPFVIKSSLGSNFVLITEKTQPVKKYNIAEVSVKVTPSTETYNKLYNDLNQYISQNNNSEAFRNSASEAGYVIQTDVPVFPNQASIAPIQNSRQVIRWAFESKKGKMSDIFECDDYFVVASVVGSAKEGYHPLDEQLTNVLRRELMNKKKGEKIVADLKSKNISSLEQYAQTMDTEVKEAKFITFNSSNITGIGMEPIVNAMALNTEVGKVSEPFAGNNAVFVISVKDKNENQAYNEQTVKSQVQMQNFYTVANAIQSGILLQENAKIEDNRLRFY